MRHIMVVCSAIHQSKFVELLSGVLNQLHFSEVWVLRFFVTMTISELNSATILLHILVAI
jgi:hypothetical protein